MAQTSAIANPCDPLIRKNRYTIAKVLSWDTQREIDADEIETIALTNDMLWVKLTDNRAIPIHVETFRSIRRQQLEAVGDLQNPNIEIDSDDSSTPTYRVWEGFKLIGTFHQSPVDDKWLTNPVYGRDYCRHTTSEEAIAAIISTWNDAIEVRHEQGLEAA